MRFGRRIGGYPAIAAGPSARNGWAMLTGRWGWRARKGKESTMTRIDFRPWAGLALSVAVLGYVGCTSSSPTSSSPASPAGSGSAGAGARGARRAARPTPRAGADSKLLANLGNPAAVLVVTGEMDGYLEPCGCTEGQIGGLLRRYDFFERLRKQNWPVASIDLGSLTKDPAGRPRRLRAGEVQVRLRDQGPEAAQLQRPGPQRRGHEGRRRRGPGPVPQQPGRDDQDRRRQRRGAGRVRVACSGPAWSSRPGR